VTLAHWTRLLSGELNPNSRTTMENPLEFLQEVRQEANKVTWPTRRETITTTALVILLVLFSSLFFLAVDQVLRFIVRFILGLGH